MSRRKGLSLEEKRSKMLEIFHEKKDFFQLKELEKIGPKEKGVISQVNFHYFFKRRFYKDEQAYYGR